MSCYKEIGGYLDLELLRQEKTPWSDNSVVLLNTGRNCLRCLVRFLGIKEIFVPSFTCPVVWKTLKEEGCSLHFYEIGKDLLPTTGFPITAFILYTNYFGVCARKAKKLAAAYPNLILDNAQAFYMPNTGRASFTSFRKFFGVPDGASLYCKGFSAENLERAVSFERCQHLLKRADISARAGFSDYQQNETLLAAEPPQQLSKLTASLMQATDIYRARQIRLENFAFLHNSLHKNNLLNIELSAEDVPLVYPYLTKDTELRNKLLAYSVFTARYWDNCPAQDVISSQNLVAIPIDQRYGQKNMEYILQIIRQEK